MGSGAKGFDMVGIGIVGIGFMGMIRTRIPFFAPTIP
jgi:hypothetical protein